LRCSDNIVSTIASSIADYFEIRDISIDHIDSIGFAFFTRVFTNSVTLSTKVVVLSKKSAIQQSIR